VGDSFKDGKKQTVRRADTKQEITVDLETWLYNALEHETLHIVINNLIDKDTSFKLDNDIQGKNLEYERLKERVETNES
jgi:hypothetical protein